MNEIVRVLRVLEYVGTREWVEMSLKNRLIKGTWSPGGGTTQQIKEAIIGEFPEILKEASDGTSKD